MIATARRLAGQHPNAKLPCQVCAGSVGAANLDKHLAKVHPDASDVAPPWRGKGALGIFPCSVAIAGSEVTLRYVFGLMTRIVSLPASLEAGSLWRSQPNAIIEHAPATDVRAGRYVRIQCPRSRIGITVGCRGGVRLAEHWTGATQGERRRSADVVIAREAMVALEYALAERGLLAPAC